MSSHATLGAAADDRKARLAKLKTLKRKQPEPEETTPSDPEAAAATTTSPPAHTLNSSDLNPPTTDVARLHLSGRNYDPSTKGPKLGFEAPPTLGLTQPTLEEQAADLEDESRRQAAVAAQDERGIDLFTLQPKRPNWDLKRELGARMEVLHVRTENAIARLVRERLAEKKAGAAAATAGSGASRGKQAGEGEDGVGDAEAEGMLDGAAIVEGLRVREREEEEEARREREAEAEEFGMA